MKVKGECFSCKVFQSFLKKNVSLNPFMLKKAGQFYKNQVMMYTLLQLLCACNTVLLDFEQRQHKVYVQKNGKVEMMICSQAVLSLDINNVDVGLLV